MKTLSIHFHNLLMASLIILISVPAFSQEQITHGLEYWLGVPNCRIEQGEPYRFGEYPIMLWLSSKVATEATITIDAIGVTQTVQISPNKTTIFELTDLVMNKESEKKTNYGIHVVGKDPITVCVYIAYKWSGEAFRCIPVEWLGRKYVSTNMYLEKTEEYKPGQILIIGTQDGTDVTYKPTSNTVKVKKGNVGSVTLNKGECFLIEGRVKGYEGLKQDWITDLTGTFIQSSKPVAVISGHTKGAFPRYQTGMPDNYEYRWANFLRNMLTEMLWPVELLGKEYISAPIKYRDRERGLSGVADDYGDLIRFVAPYDNTKLYQMRQNGSGYKKIGPDLNAQDWYNLENMEDAAQYMSNKPIMVAQYGKSWMNENVPGNPDDDKTKRKGDDPLNPHRNGQGMLLLLAPMDHWTSYAQFRSPQEIDNFIYITFKVENRQRIYYDGQNITGVFGPEIRQIAGTDYAYITKEVSPGDHYFTADSGVTFAAYAYGNWDNTKDGFAYGYPTGINYASVCEDTLLVDDDDTCGTVVGEAWVEPEDSSCAVLFSIRFIEDDSYNYNADIEDFDPIDAKRAGFTLEVIDIKKPAKAVLIFMSRSGETVRKEYYYYPEEIEADPSEINFGVLTLGEKKCFDVTLRNPGEVETTIYELYLKHNYPEFEITSDDLPVTIPPKGEVTIQACATALKELGDEELIDTLVASLSCFEEAILELKMGSGEPIIHITDADFGAVPINVEFKKRVKITNKGTLAATITSYTWDDKLHFPRTEGLDNNLPLKLEPNEDFDFTVIYKADVINVEHIDTADFVAITDVGDPVTKDKLWSEWKGEGLDASVIIQGYDFGERRIVKPVDGKNDSTQYEWHVKIWTTGNDTLDVNSLSFDDDFGGVYEVDKTNLKNKIIPGDTIYLPLYFKPNAEADFNTEVTISGSVKSVPRSASAEVLGTGVQPHVDVAGYDFTTPILVTETANGMGYLKNFGSMDLLVDNLYINGPQKDAFEIDSQFDVDNPNRPIILKPGEQIPVPYIFKPYDQNIIDYNAKINTQSDSWNPDEDSDDLIGHIYIPKIRATDHNYGTIFKTLTATAEVSLINEGTNEIKVTNKNILISGPNASQFRLVRYYISSAPGVDDPSPIILQPGEELRCEVQFQPMDVGQFDAMIVYETDFMPDTSFLFGGGKIIKTIARIPDNYKAAPSLKIENVPTVEVFIDKDPDETELLRTANIYEFECYVQFENDVRTEPIFNVYPDLNIGILQKTTMTEGWDIVGTPDVIDDKTLHVHMRQTDMNKPLAASSDSDVLFAFKLQPFLGESKVVDLPVDFRVIGVPKNYVEIKNIPGKITIDAVCVDNLRLVKAFGVDYSISNADPNPTNSLTKIKYGVGLEARTKIELFNYNGDKVGTLIDQTHKPGEYELEFDVSKVDLPTGIYYYRITSGPYQETKSMIILK